MYIAIVCFPGCDIINFEINLIFLIKSFFYMTEKSRQKFKHVENEKSFSGEIKIIFIIFLRPESAPLMMRNMLSIHLCPVYASCELVKPLNVIKPICTNNVTERNSPRPVVLVNSSKHQMLVNLSVPVM